FCVSRLFCVYASPLSYLSALSLHDALPICLSASSSCWIWFFLFSSSFCLSSASAGRVACMASTAAMSSASANARQRRSRAARMRCVMPFPPLPADVEMLADAGGGADAAQHKAERDKPDDHEIPHLLQRDQRAAEHLGQVGGVFKIPAVQRIVRPADDAGGDGRRQQAGGGAFDKEWE